MAAQQRMSTVRGFPYQGSRGSLHGSAFGGAAATAPSAAWADSVVWADSISGTLMRQPPNVWHAPWAAATRATHVVTRPRHSVAVAPAFSRIWRWSPRWRLV